jgi:hypothetical protein
VALVSAPWPVVAAIQPFARSGGPSTAGVPTLETVKNDSRPPETNMIHHYVLALCLLTSLATFAQGRTERLQALDTLRWAQTLLATGDSEGVDEELLQAEDALSGRTRLDVEAARKALARSDLLPARQFLAAALAERRSGR